MMTAFIACGPITCLRAQAVSDQEGTSCGRLSFPKMASEAATAIENNPSTKEVGNRYSVFYA
jgi:hypothetical protein